MSNSCSLLLRQGRLVSAPASQVDIAIQGGVISAIAPTLEMTADTVLDLEGGLISPPFVESHIHLDSALTAGQPRWNQSGTLFEGIEIWRDRKQSLTLEDVKTRAIAALKLQASQGVLFVRSHADVSEPHLTPLKALLEVREAVKDWMTLQVVAFPQDGIYSNPENAERLAAAVQLGADVVGGIPHYELTREDGVNAVRYSFDLAAQYDRLMVTASHTTAFGSYNNAYALKLMGFLQRSRLNFIANPLINLTLQGRTDTYPKRRGLTRVKELWQHGLNVSLGHDCIQDPWYSLGTGNLLEVAAMAVHACQMTGQEELSACYEMITTNGARTLGLGDRYGVAVGKPANLIVLDAADAIAAIRTRATVCHVIAQGRLLVSTRPPQVSWQRAVGELP